MIIWITGLPGSGKSTIAKELLKLIDFKYLRLDLFRKEFVKEPKYTDEERDYVYKKLVDKALEMKDVIIDATAHKKKYRDFARQKTKLIEVYVKCGLNESMKRESTREGLSDIQKNMYKKALQGEREGLGQVIGIDVPYEENSDAEIIIDSEKLSPQEAAEKIANFINKS